MQVFTSVLVLTIFFLAFIITDIRQYKERKVSSMKTLAHVIGLNSVSALEFRDNEAAKDMLLSLKDNSPEVVHAEITDKDGKPFASYTRPGIPNVNTPGVVSGENVQLTGEQLFVSDNIINSNNEQLGKVSLEVGLSELEETKKAKYRLAAVLLLIALGFSFVIAVVVQAYISKRLLYLINNMNEAGKTGNYNIRIADEGKDEIGTLMKVFNKLMQQVTESQQRKDEFIGIASHELKTPLTSIKGYLDLLNVVEEKQPNKQFVQKSLDSVQKLESLIKDLLDVSKIQSGQLQLNITQFDINALIDETIASMQMISASHRISRENDPGPLLVSADRQRIEQVLINILSNAIKYSPGENKVVVSTKNTGAELVIKVRDYGIGIAAEELTDIFERFYRTKDSSVHISGFGLGLYICRDIMQRHKGKIWVEREEKGSSFYFALPINKQ
ncbi:MAG TPA: ATP-binding protein [Ferruginibacter sp.]|nr:ATP-binding protein [Ferruginibacter sp.]